MHEPKVSVIMNCFNSDKYLSEAIESVFNQTYKDWEIIFWNNQSTDNSAEIAKSFEGKLKYFRGDKFLPLGAARNEATKKADGEYIAFLDCDDVWLAQKLERQIRLFQDDPGLGLAYSNFQIIDKLGHVLRNGEDNLLYKGRVFERLLKECFILWSSVVIKRSVLDDIGNFDSSFNIAEDLDILLRLTYKYKVDYIQEPLVKYRVHESNYTRNRALVFKESYELYSRLLDGSIGGPSTKKLIRKEILEICLKFAYLDLIKDRNFTGAFDKIRLSFSIYDNKLFAFLNMLDLINPSNLRKLKSFLNKD